LKVVTKPWGKEVWLELNDKYCYKRIYIKSGTRTSYQYHNKKLETNYIISGEAEVWLENDEGIVEKKSMKSDDFFTVLPGRKHRVIAKTDIILQEVSTPEVDDVIRIEDDTRRNDGRLEYEHMPPAICILTAGKGTRMGQYGKHVNKSLLPIDNVAMISHAIEKTDSNYEIVVALGYKSNQVREYCEAAHPDRKFIFVDVENFEGPRSGPGTSLLACKKYLQRPFYFITADCLIEGDLPAMGNWLGVYPTSIPEIYSTVDVKNGQAIKLINKNKNGYSHAFTGLCAIQDFETFWSELENNMADSGEMVSAFYDLSKYKSMKAVSLKWHDAGTIDNYLKANSRFTSEKMGIPKSTGQFIYKVGDNVLKLFQQNVESRVKRADNLGKLVPEIKYHGKNILSYKWEEGTTLYNKLDFAEKFMNWSVENLWEKEDVDITKQCYQFYRDKTLERVSMILSENSKIESDKSYIINGKKYHSLDYYLKKIDWSKVCEGSIPTKIYHGDLQFDNIVLTPNSDFKIIDWRESFGSQHDYGDAYYDLAKMYGGICMNYSGMKDENNYSCTFENDEASYEYSQNAELKDLEQKFPEWASNNSFDFDKIKTITALIFLNMSPLHDNGFDDLLFFHAITKLHECLES
jgi:choline kinase/mannose-6-phosphate isomerase-like protein (cupin superfamily)/thiamine kinase-like enzyme